MREQILELLRTDPEFREEVRRLILTEDLLALPSKVDQLVEAVRELTAVQRQQAEQIRALAEAQRRTEERVEALAEAQRRTEERLEALVEAQRRTEEGLQELRNQVSALVIAQQRMEEALQWLINWQRGEMGRREGERYEREVIQRAPVIFKGGHGGPPEEPSVQKRLTALLSREQMDRLFNDKEEDPFLADLIWWKGEKVAVVEISLQVDGYDVVRARRRAGTLREAGVEAIAMVVGREWANPGAYDAALHHKVEWLIGAEMSDGFKKFREA